MAIEKFDRITIYVRRRVIIRDGKRVPGWQAGLSETGGPTDADRDEAVAAARQIARAVNPLATIIVRQMESASKRGKVAND